MHNDLSVQTEYFFRNLAEIHFEAAIEADYEGDMELLEYHAAVYNHCCDRYQWEIRSRSQRKGWG